MSRDAISHDPQDAGDLRDTSTRRSVRRTDRSTPNAERAGIRYPQDPGRGDSSETRDQHHTRDERSDSPRAYYVRDRAYLLRESEMHALKEIGKFRVIAVDGSREVCLRWKSEGDGQRHSPPCPTVSPYRQDHGNLAEENPASGDPYQSWASPSQEDRINFPMVSPFTTACVKPREVKHDADLYRLYQKEADRIERSGGRPVRVLLDYELKRNLNRDLAFLDRKKTMPDAKQRIAERHALASGKWKDSRARSARRI